MSVSVNQRRTRRCSFCFSEYHDIRRCVDESLIIFEAACHEKKASLRNYINAKEMFGEWLRNSSLHTCVIIRTFAISRCGSTLNKSTAYYANIVKDYFYGAESQLESQEERVINAYGVISPLELALRAFIELIDSILTANRVVNNQNSNNIEISFMKLAEPESNGAIECVECVICWESVKKENFVNLGCGHEFCKDCIQKSMLSYKKNGSRCPCCRAEIVKITSRSKEVETELSKFISTI